MAVYNVGFKFENREQTHYMIIKTDREGLEAVRDHDMWKNMSSASANSKITIVSAELIWANGVEANDIIYQFVLLRDIGTLGMQRFDITSKTKITEDFVEPSQGLVDMARETVNKIATLLKALGEFEEKEQVLEN